MSAELPEIGIVDGSGERYRVVGVRVELLMQSMDNPGRAPVWISEEEMSGLRDCQWLLNHHRDSTKLSSHSDTDVGSAGGAA